MEQAVREFDKLEIYENGSTKCEYGIMLGGTELVFIKAGLGGNYRGYEDKYLKIAGLLNEEYGRTVICASNEEGASLDFDVKIIEKYKAILGDKCKIYFFGHSDGGRCGLDLAKDIHFERMILVNMPLMINMHKKERAIKELTDTKISLICGERDPSYSYLPFIEVGKPENLEIIRIPGADHNFKGMTEEFIQLSRGL